MSVAQFVSIVRARIWVALLVFVLTVGTAVTTSLLLPKQYTATASLVVDQTRPDPISGVLYQPYTWPAYLATQVDVIKSDRVAHRVVRNLKLAELPDARQQWLSATEGTGSFETWLAERLQLNMDVKPSRESNVVNVAYTGSDPVSAASLVNAFVQAYMDVSLELRVDPAKQSSSFFDSRAKELRENVERAQARLSAYQREKGIIATDEKLDIETARLNELSTQLTALQAVTSESSSRQVQAQGVGAERLQEVVNNPLLATLRADLSRAEGRLQELSSRLGDNHPLVQEAKANISSLRARVDSETRRVVGSVGVTSTINRQREAELRSLLEAQRAKVLRMKAVRDEGGVMLRDIENAQRAYDAVLVRLSQTSLESQTTHGNLSVLTEATPPRAPSSPKIALNTILSIFVGLILAIGAALLRELVDRRVRTVDEMTALLGMPVLGVLPKPGVKGAFASRRIPLVSPLLLGRVPAPHREA